MKASFKNIFDPARQQESRRASAWLLAPLLVAALIVCHGAIGDADQIVLELAPPTSSDSLPITGSSADLHSGDHSVDHPVDHSASHVDYVVAVLFAGLCASVLGRLFGDWRTSRYIASSGVRRPTLDVVSPSVLAARPPTTLEVQVFRL